uniref:Kinesin motor domain-containing protein n=1 Tax=Oryza nivara TaxID=4536 RepID=A0A0E0J375_ORYNI
MEKISVAVRFRPPTTAAPAADQSPSSTGGDREWRVDDDTRITLLHRSAPVPGASFAFDHVFDGAATNERIYGVLVRSLIRAAVDGFNGTAFAYGQTSSGKTFTMNGSGDHPGIIPLAVRDVFDTAREVSDREFLIRVSYMEIYNEEINDLLTLGSEKLPIHESLERGVYVSGLREEIVNSAEQVFKLLELGEERIAKTGAGGVRLKEGKHINKSLMILGNVINKLSENGKQRGHIPYRDSKLTRILQPALGGNAKTSIICTAAPEEIHVEETRGTLQFASRAKCVSNCAQVNEILTDAALLKRQKQEIEELRKKLQGSHSEVLEQVILKQRNDMHKSELERDRLAMELDEERRLRETLEHRLAEQQKMLDGISNTSISPDQFTDSIQFESLKTPTSKERPAEFVASRANYSKDVEFSPIPENLGTVADEDLWMQLNKGCVTDLEMLEMTPGFKCATSLADDKASVATPDEEPIDARCQRLEKDCTADRQQLEDSKAWRAALEEERDTLKRENSSLLDALAKARQDADRLVADRLEALRELDMEKSRMDELKQEIKLFSQAFSLRQGQLTSLYTKSKAIVENCKTSQLALP